MTKKKDKKGVKQSIPYSGDERSRKVTKIMLQLVTLNMDHVLSDEVREKIHRYIKTGEEYHEDIDLPTYSRVLEIHLVNNKNRDKDTYMKLAFKKVRVKNSSGHEDDNNPINKLNKIQAELFDDTKGLVGQE